MPQGRPINQFSRPLSRLTVSIMLRSLFSAPAATLGALARFAGRKYFTDQHEWIDEEGFCGVTNYAQKHLGQIVFVELPEVGTKVAKKETVASLESVKAVSEVFAPVVGEVTEVNEALAETPDLINKSALKDGWIAKLKMDDPAMLSSLMDEAKYKEFEAQAH
eukprot:gnl/Trimastix_PCT/193.p2 GENE.gnl/Trimastix_PCT/193~~gnl/Trimastix_PCT/193.p2  ORF type:complete len:163 (+),score=43.25 gnl/Trimastix_PCT/193:3-491(+)